MNFMSNQELFSFLESLDYKNMKDYLLKLALNEVDSGKRFSKKSLFIGNIIYVQRRKTLYRFNWKVTISESLFNKNKKIRKRTQLFLDEIKIFKKVYGG